MPALAITDDDVFTGLIAFLAEILPGIGKNNIRQGQGDRVPMPPGPDFVVVVPTERGALATTTRDYDPDAGERITTRSTQVGCAVNFYGPCATDNAQIFNTLFRDLYGCDFLAPFHVAPLWCDDGRQMPLLDAEKQYETRWMIRALLQVNPPVSTRQEFADTVEATLRKAD